MPIFFKESHKTGACSAFYAEVGKIKIKLEDFKSNKNYDIQDFKNSLHLLHEELCKNYNCTDLQKILSNYFNNNIQYIFHILNIRNLSNCKKHEKELQKIFFNQLNKIVEEYIKIISLNKDQVSETWSLK